MAADCLLGEALILPKRRVHDQALPKKQIKKWHSGNELKGYEGMFTLECSVIHQRGLNVNRVSRKKNFPRGNTSLDGVQQRARELWASHHLGPFFAKPSLGSAAD